MHGLESMSMHGINALHIRYTEKKIKNKNLNTLFYIQTIKQTHYCFTGSSICFIESRNWSGVVSFSKTLQQSCKWNVSSTPLKWLDKISTLVFQISNVSCGLIFYSCFYLSLSTKTLFLGDFVESQLNAKHPRLVQWFRTVELPRIAGSFIPLFKNWSMEYAGRYAIMHHHFRFYPW